MVVLREGTVEVLPCRTGEAVPLVEQLAAMKATKPTKHTRPNR
jgi:hypothetical protein